MKTLKTLLLFFVLFFTSCTITQEFHFNKDFSGSTKLSIDMGSLIEMMASMDSSGLQSNAIKDSLDMVFDKNLGKLDSIGVKNVKYGWEEGNKILYLSYDFKDIEMLSKSLTASESANGAFGNADSTKSHVFFTLKGKTLSYKGLKSTNEASNNPDMESMKDYYKYNLIFTFERKVKSIDNPNVVLSPDGKRVELKGSMFEIIRPEYNSDIKFKLK
ncbi:MAG: hypothetical protein U0W24_17395 [Bacteroidales bacterium]